MKKNAMKILGLLFLLCLCVCVKGNASEAAEINTEDVTIGLNDTFKVNTYDVPDKAKLIYSISNKSVATAKGQKITTKKIGKTKVTVFYKVGKKKKTKYMIYNIEVKKAELYDEFKVYITNQTGYFEKNQKAFKPSIDIMYINKKADYLLVSKDPKMVKYNKDGYVVYSSGTGKVTVDVVESYKKKKRTIGSFQTVIESPCTYNDTREFTIPTNRKFVLGDIFDNLVGYRECWTDDPNEVIDPNSKAKDELIKAGTMVTGNRDNTNIINNGASLYASFTKAGTYYAEIFAYNYLTKKYETTPLARFTIQVVGGEPVSDFKLIDGDSEDDYYYFESSGDSLLFDLANYSYDEEDAKSGELDYYFTIKLLPLGSAGKITIENDNPDVIEIAEPYYEEDYMVLNFNYNIEDEYMKYYADYRIHGVGTAHVTIRSGGFSKTYTLTVK